MRKVGVATASEINRQKLATAKESHNDSPTQKIFPAFVLDLI
jgi:hypothetical protein